MGRKFEMPYNGPAIKGGCVTRRQHRAESWFFSREIVTVQGGYGTCFCRPGTNFIESLRVSRYKVDKWPISCLGYRGLVNGHWRSVAVQVVSEPVICHGTAVLLLADARIRVHHPTPFLSKCRKPCKNRDKQLTFIVRVSCRDC